MDRRLEAVDLVLRGRENQFTRAGAPTVFPLFPGAIFPEFVQPPEELIIILEIDAQNPLLQGDDFEIPATISTEHIIEWLQENRDTFMQTGNRTQTYKLLVKLADELEVFPPGHDSPMATAVEDAEWLTELINEMTDILENNRREATDFHVYARTTWPYSEALRALAVRVAEHDSNSNIFFEADMPVNRGRRDYIDWMQRMKAPIWKILSPDSQFRLRYPPSRVLRMLAEDLNHLSPRNELPLDSDRDSCWEQLLNDMKMIDSLPPDPEIRFGGVYVLHASPYKEFLRNLADELSTKGM